MLAPPLRVVLTRLTSSSKTSMETRRRMCFLTVRNRNSEDSGPGFANLGLTGEITTASCYDGLGSVQPQQPVFQKDFDPPRNLAGRSINTSSSYNHSIRRALPEGSLLIREFPTDPTRNKR